MAGLRMDGTKRPIRGEVTPAKIAKHWFDSHPENVVSYRWRWDELPVASRDMLALPRLAIVYGNKVVFGPHRSELSLVGLTEAKITDTGRLQIRFGTGGMVEYAACNQS